MPGCLLCLMPEALRMSSPTQRSLALLRERGYVAQVVEQTIRGAGIVFKRARGRDAARANAKIAECEHVGAIRKAGWRLMVHGWRKLKGRWIVREVDVS